LKGTDNMNRRCLRLVFLMTTVLCGSKLWAQALASEATSTGPAKPTGFVPPFWLQFSGELRSRVEGYTGGGFKPNSHNAYLLTRVRLGLKIQPRAWLKLVVQGQDAHAFGKDQPTGPAYVDAFDLHQSYIEIGDPDMSFSFRAGRQELAFGDERLIGNSDWTNTARTFDGFRVAIRSADLRLDYFAASVVNVRDLRFNRHTPGNNIYGVYAGFDELVPEATVEPFFFWRRSSGMTTEAGAPGILNVGTLGLRIAGKLPAGLDYATEMAGQMGSLGADTVRAWASHFAAGYSFPHSNLSARVFVEYNYATGDRNPSNGVRGTFDQLYPTGHDKYGMADQVGWKNIQHLRSGLEYKLRAHWQAKINHNIWWLADSHDALYDAQSNVVAQDVSGAAGRFIGQEIDLQTSYSFPFGMEASGGFGHIFPGNFLYRTTPGVGFNFPNAMLRYTF
jgi:hypothetical protein